MSLAAALEAESTRIYKGPLCTVTRLLSHLPDDDAAALRGALDDPEVKTSTIWRALKRNGNTISENTLARHRRRACACP